jgi:hypothetical protein
MLKMPSRQAALHEFYLRAGDCTSKRLSFSKLGIIAAQDDKTF